MSRVLVLGDLHSPFADMYLLKEIAKYNKHFKAEKVIQLGDAVDFAAISRFQKAPDDSNMKDELDHALNQMDEIHKLFPVMTLLIGNHTNRLMTRAREANFARKMIRTPDELFAHDGWDFWTSPKMYVFEKIGYLHGDETIAELRALARRVGRSVIRGHFHRLGIHYDRTFDNLLFAVDAGCLIDEEAAAFSYCAQNPGRSGLGFVTVEAGFPTIIPLC
jgi:predicted phosphodiesterase